MKKLMLVALVVAVALMAVTPAVAESGKTQHFFITIAGVDNPTLYEVWVTTGERVTLTVIPATWDDGGWKLAGEKSGDIRLREGELIYRPPTIFTESKKYPMPDEIPLAPKNGMWELPSGY